MRFSLLSAFFMLCLCFDFLSCHQEKKENPALVSPDWIKLGPGGGGATFIPTFSPFSPDVFLLRCDMTGAYLTTNGGLSYRQFNLPNGASAFAFDPHDSNTLYIGGYSLLRSTDGGASWFSIFPDSNHIKGHLQEGDHANFKLLVSDTSIYHDEDRSIDAICIDPDRPANIYFSMGEYFYYSADIGKTWKQERLKEKILSIYRSSDELGDHEMKGRNIFIFTPTGFYQFNPDQAASLIYKDIPSEFSPAFSFTAGRDTSTGKTYFYALHQESPGEQTDEFGNTIVIRSDDKGVTWKKVTYPRLTNITTGITPSFSMIACAEFDARQAYLVCNKYLEKKPLDGFSFYYGVLKTMNAGADWDWVWRGGGGSGQYGVKDGSSPSNLEDAWANKAFGGEYIRVMDVGVYPRGGNYAVITDWYRTMKTNDGGTHWHGVYSKQQDDSSYSTVGLDVTTTYGVHVDPFNKNHIAISYTDIGYHHSFNGGRSWTRSVNGIPAEWVNTCYWVAFDPQTPGKLWSAWSGMHDIPRGKMTRKPEWKQNARGGVALSTDSGKTWIPSNEGMGNDAPTTSIILDPKSPAANRTLYAAVYNKGVFKSTDDGKTWQLKNNGIEDNTCAFELTLSPNGELFLVVSPTPKFPGGVAGREIYSGAVYRSTDGAENWTKLNIRNGFLFPSGIDIDPKQPNRIFMACWSDIGLGDLIGGKLAKQTGGDSVLHSPGGILLSEDGGQSWRQIFDSTKYIYDVTIDPYHPGTIYCNGFSGAAFKSADLGKTWKPLEGYDFHWGHRVIIDPTDKNKVYLTTYGSSVWHGTPQTKK